MDSSGQVMNLEGKQQSEALVSSVLGERQYYVLLQVCRESTKVSEGPRDCAASSSSVISVFRDSGIKCLDVFRAGDDDTGGRKYVSLLNNFSQNHPELTGNKRPTG